jgi:hypothetical protein
MTDLAFVEAVVDEVWTMVMGELDAMKQLEAYESAQREGAHLPQPSYPSTVNHEFAASAIHKSRT